MQNCTFLVLLRPNFGEKLKTVPPPPKEIGCRSCEVHVVIRSEKSVSISVKTFFFAFGDHLFLGGKTFEFLILAEKSVSISMKTFFFFWRSPVFGQTKHLNFRAFREVLSQVSNKPCDSDSRRTKIIRVKVVCSFLAYSKKPPFFKSWLRD